jgi:hypothetical protein
LRGVIVCTFAFSGHSRFSKASTRPCNQRISSGERRSPTVRRTVDWALWSGLFQYCRNRGGPRYPRSRSGHARTGLTGDDFAGQKLERRWIPFEDSQNVIRNFRVQHRQSRDLIYPKPPSIYFLVLLRIDQRRVGGFEGCSADRLGGHDAAPQSIQNPFSG